jgi:hypothetical protein
MIFFCTNIAINLDGINSAEEAIIEKGLLIWFLVYILTGILTVLDAIFAGICVKKENP